MSMQVELTGRVLAALGQHISVYAALPQEQLKGDIAQVIERALRMFREVLRQRRQPSNEELAGVRESAARRAEEGVPIDAVLTAYHVGVSVCAELVQTDAGPEDVADLMAVQQLILGFLQRISAEVAAGYFEARRTMLGDEHNARQALLSALLEGIPAELPARQAGIRLPPAYLVLHLHVAEHQDERDQRVNASVVARRRLRRLRVELEHQSPEPILSLLSADGGVALVPAPDVSTVDWKHHTRMLERLALAAGTPIVAGAVVADTSGVPAAAVLAREIMLVARAFGRPPGLYRLADLLVEYQLTRPSPARAQLASLLTPIEGDADLLITLRTFVGNGHNRQRAARLLHVHPNTVDYRLRKIAAQTGLDATLPADLPRIAAALAARDASAPNPAIL